jgi:hypothetical protein
VLLVFPAVVRPLVGEAVDRDERAIQDGVGQPTCSCRGGDPQVQQGCGLRTDGH